MLNEFDIIRNKPKNKFFFFLNAYIFSGQLAL